MINADKNNRTTHSYTTLCRVGLALGFAGVMMLALHTPALACVRCHLNANTNIHASTGSDSDPIIHSDDIVQLAQQPPDAVAFEDIQLSPLAQSFIDDPYISDQERHRLKVFHGLIDQIETPATYEQAWFDLMIGHVHSEALQEAQAETLTRAWAALHRGEPEQTLELLQTTVDGQADNANEQSALPRWHLEALAYLAMGETAKAHSILRHAVMQMQQHRLNNPAAMTAGAQILALLADMEGVAGNRYETAMDLLAAVRRGGDANYWPALLAEGRLLMSKDNREQAYEALLEAAALNPNHAETWYWLGHLFAEVFDFDRAEAALQRVKTLHHESLWRYMLDARLQMQQRRYPQAKETLEAAISLYPTHRELLGLQLAVAMLQNNTKLAKAVQTQLDMLAPGSIIGQLIAGEALSMARQYEQGEAMLREAIARHPHSAQAHVELGLLLMQKGDDPAAHEVLREAARLDPYHRQARNQLHLVEHLLSFDAIETEHFEVKFQPGIDRVLAEDMAEQLEQIYDDLTTIFAHEPPRKTRIDLMPDKQWFAVRITGMPDIWTIAAATGDVISLTPPREGRRQSGGFDWATVIRHEYVHTVNLSQTNNRVPHWLTEACAVSQELTGRNYENHKLLAWAWHEDKLFTLQDINWGFIRPQAPYERPLAYQQAAWMLEYIEETFEDEPIVTILEAFGEGKDQPDVFMQVLGVDEDTFFDNFHAWAGKQVQAWGLGKHDADDAVQAMLEQDNLTLETLNETVDQYPTHPDLLQAMVQKLAAEDAMNDALVYLDRYREVRPVDDWPDRWIVRQSDKLRHTDRLIAALHRLDEAEMMHAAWAWQLARIYEHRGMYDKAYDAAVRSLLREPYNATYREHAARFALLADKSEQALRHLRTLPLLEPDRVQHLVRLAAMYHRLGENDKANSTARKALAIDANAPVQPFLQN